MNKKIDQNIEYYKNVKDIEHALKISELNIMTKST